MPDISGPIHGDYEYDSKEAGTNEPEKKEPVISGSDSDIEPGSMRPRDMSVLNIDHRIPRKTYWQKLALTTTSPGRWSQFLRHAWQPFLILASIPGIAYCSLVYAIVLAWSVVMTTVLSIYMLDPPYNFTATQIGLMNLAPCKCLFSASLI